MVRNKPAGDAFASNRRSPTLLRRKRELELKAAQDGEEFSYGDVEPGSLRRSSSVTARLMSFCLAQPVNVFLSSAWFMNWIIVPLFLEFCYVCFLRFDSLIILVVES